MTEVTPELKMKMFKILTTNPGCLTPLMAAELKIKETEDVIDALINSKNFDFQLLRETKIIDFQVQNIGFF